MWIVPEKKDVQEVRFEGSGWPSQIRMWSLENNSGILKLEALTVQVAELTLRQRSARTKTEPHFPGHAEAQISESMFKIDYLHHRFALHLLDILTHGFCLSCDEWNLQTLVLKAERDACLLEHTTGALQRLSNCLSSWRVHSILILMILWRGWIPLRLGVGFFDRLLSMLDYGKQLMLPSRQTAPHSRHYSCLCLFERVLFTLKTGLKCFATFFSVRFTQEYATVSSKLS